MKCLKCGAEISEDANFCYFCGVENIKAKVDSEKTADEYVATSEMENRNIQISLQINQDARKKGSSTEKKSLGDIIKNKIAEFWNMLTIFGKISTITLCFFAFLSFIAFVFQKPYAGYITVVQILLIISAILIKKQIIKVQKTWVYIVLFIFSFLLVIPYFNVMGEKNIDAGKYVWTDINMADYIPEPKSHLGNIITNTQEMLFLEVYKTSEERYEDYIEACKEMGYTVDVTRVNDMFDAFNSAGYKLYIHYDSDYKKMSINLEEPVKLGVLKWPNDGLANLITIPQSTNGRIEKNEEDGFSATVGDLTFPLFKEYTESCMKNGFDLNLTEKEKSLYAENADGYKLIIEYQGNNTVFIEIEEPEYYVEIEVNCEENWVFDKYDVKIFIDNYEEDTLSHGSSANYTKMLTKGEYNIKFVSEEDSSITGNIVANITQDESYIFEISCLSNNIQVTTISGTVIDETDENIAEVEPEANSLNENIDEIEITESIDELTVSLEKNIKKEMAERAVIVAMTNCYATDVFSSDGNTYDTSKFHSFSDINDYFMSIDTDGEWTATNDKIWHVEGMVLRIHGYDTYLKISCDVTKENENYIVSEVNSKIALKDYLDSDDSSKINEEHYEYSESTPFLIITPDLIDKDRDSSAETSKIEAETERAKWINNQFSWWDNSHIELEALIKENLNDEKSYSFINSSYIDVSDEDVKKEVNGILKSMEIIERVEVGDLLVVVDFSAKNAFNATVKSSAYGIVSYDDNTTTLIYIE